MLSVGLIGLGRMGRLHMMNCLHIDGVRVTAAADASKKALRRAKKLGCHDIYADFHDLLGHSQNLDAVIITLPNFLHSECINLALEAGLHVFTEKPMARNSEECRRILSNVQKCGRKFMIGHNFRFVKAIETMKEAVESGHIGNIESITIEEIINGPFSHPAVPIPVSNWWFDPDKSGGGALLDIGYHLIDLYRFFAGNAKVLYSSLDHKFNLPIEDGATVFLGCQDSDTKGVINVGWWQKTVFPRFNFRLILHGNAGYISSDELIPRNLYTYALKEGAKNFLRRLIGKKIHPLSYTYIYESYFKELDHFFDCIKLDLETKITVNDGLEAVKLIEEAYNASNGK